MILHICFPSKFITQFVTFMSRHFYTAEHEFLFTSTENDLRRTDPQTHALLECNDSPFRVWYYADERHLLTRNAKLFRALYGCEKIILHGLFLPRRISQILCYCPSLLRKSYWVMWGGDFYSPEDKGPTHKRLIRNMEYLVTFVSGDISYVVANYQASGTPIECLAYPSNVFQPMRRPARKDKKTRIQVGNSATSTNRHEEIFCRLTEYKDREIEVICPLSYGDKQYADTIIALGTKIFSEKFIPLTEFLPLEEYVDLLASIDIAIFNHNRQQGMGNIITHLGYGHKVYLRSDQNSWGAFVEKGIKVYDVLEGIDIDYVPSKRNRELVADHFSLDRLVEQWRMIYESTP